MFQQESVLDSISNVCHECWKGEKGLHIMHVAICDVVILQMGRLRNRQWRGLICCISSPRTVFVTQCQEKSVALTCMKLIAQFSQVSILPSIKTGQVTVWRMKSCMFPGRFSAKEGPPEESGESEWCLLLAAVG